MLTPQLITSCREMQFKAQELRMLGQRVGLVPTMGALHAGHLSLVHAAKKTCDVVVTSIFVNPTQFGPREDFSKYPRTLPRDLELLEEVDCDIVFTPTAEEMYPPGFSSYVQPPEVAKVWEGAFRPDHFRGVCTVVLKLFELVPSDLACFGQKDFQQALVLRHMVRDLNLPVQMEICPILRDPDGLAMSSRNRYLSPEERQQALGLSQALWQVDALRKQGETNGTVLRETMRNILLEHGISRIDYATLADPETLGELEDVSGPTVALIACHVGTTRLIDNWWWRA